MRIFHSFETFRKIVASTALWICFALVQALVMSPIIPIPFGMLLIDGLIFSSLIVLIGVLFLILVKNANYNLIILPQTVFNYASLGLFLLLLWLGSGLSILYVVFPKTDFELIVPTIPVRALIGLLLYAGIAIFDCLVSCKVATEETDEVEDDCQKNYADENGENSDKKVLEETPPNDAAVETDSKMLERIAVKSGQKIHVISVSEIFCLQSDGDYVFIFTEKGRYLKEQTMKYFEEHLPNDGFVRIHRSCIVNVEKISRIELYKKQQQMLTLMNGHQIKASVTGYKKLRAVLHL